LLLFVFTFGNKYGAIVPVCVMCMFGRVQLMHSNVLLLLRRGADPNASLCPMPVLFFAVRSGDVDMVRLLLQKGAEPGVTLSDSVGVHVFFFKNWFTCKSCLFITFWMF